VKQHDLPSKRALIERALEIEWEHAEHAGAMAYFARILVLATMPHSRPNTSTFQRENGKFTMTMMAPPKVGLPYGSIPRLVLAWLSTEAVKTHSRRIVLGESLSAFMRQLDMVPTGGRWGSITRLRDQMNRLFSTAISCGYADEDLGQSARRSFLIADEHQLWWDPKQPEQQTLWESTITLGERFFQELVDHPVPLDLRALRALRQSPLALDIYAWLTYRMHALPKPVVIPWVALETQFGADYGATRDFRRKFLRRLKDVLAVYSRAKVTEIPGQGIRLSPSPTSVVAPVSPRLP
jgi:Plasmid encoded RepA protein